MQGKVVNIRKRAVQMGDPHPQFVAIVEGGSNNTPIRAMKADNIEDIEMASNLKRGGVSIARFSFSGDAFKTEDSVKDWLRAGGYDIPKIVTVKGDSFSGFTVASKEQPEQVHDIDLGNGVTAFVALGVKEADIVEPRATVAAVNDTPTEAPTTGAQSAAKEDEATEEAAAEPAAETPAAPEIPTGSSEKADAQAPADPGAPPAIISVAEDGTVSLVAQKSVMDIRDLADLLQALSWMKSNIDYQTYNGTYTPEIATSYRALMAALGDLMMNVAAATVAEATKSEDIDPAGTAEAAAAEGTQTSGSAPEEGGQATGESIATPQEPAAKTEMELLRATVATLAQAVTDLTGTVAQTASKADDAINKVAELQGTAPARKSADVEDIVTENPSAKQPAEKSETEKFRDQQARSLMGMR